MSSYWDLFKRNKGEKIFQNMNFDTNNFQIVALNIRNNIKQKHKHYVLNDTSKLKELIDKWRFKPAESIGRCGYDYNITFKNGPVELSMLLCFECNTLSVDSEIYEITESQIIKLLEEDFIPIRKIEKSFINKEDGQVFLEKERKNPDFIELPNRLPKWLKYQGRFTAFQKIDNSIHSEIENFNTKIEYAKNILVPQLDTFALGEDYSIDYYSRAIGVEQTNLGFFIHGSKNFFERIQTKKYGWEELSKFDMELFCKDK